jgi:hypothetical protein
MNCEKCGAEIESGGSVCQSCGAAVPIDEPVVGAVPAPTAPPAPIVQTTPPQGVPQQASQQGVVPQGYYPPQQGAYQQGVPQVFYPTQGMPQQVYYTPQVAPPQGYYPQQGVPQGYYYPHQGVPPQVAPPQGVSQQVAPPQGVHTQVTVSRTAKSKAKVSKRALIIASVAIVLIITILLFVMRPALNSLTLGTTLGLPRSTYSAVDPSTYTNTFNGECFNFNYPDEYTIEPFSTSFSLEKADGDISLYSYSCNEYTYTDFDTTEEDARDLFKVLVKDVERKNGAYRVVPENQWKNSNQYAITEDGSFVGYVLYTDPPDDPYITSGATFFVANSEKNAMVQFNFSIYGDNAIGILTTEAESIFHMLKNGYFWRTYDDILFEWDYRTNSYVYYSIKCYIPNIWSLTNDRVEEGKVCLDFNGPKGMAKMSVSFLNSSFLGGEQFTDDDILDMITQSGAVIGGTPETFSSDDINFVHVKATKSGDVTSDGKDYNYDVIYCISADKSKCCMFEFTAADWEYEADEQAYNEHMRDIAGRVNFV